MMELACAFILLFASLVSATPHGYGVKGGASARAESSASAGAYGGVGELPIAVPLGAGFSGSFSKSSSSSSSSSSASSSSSSSSFSFSGSGAGGVGYGLNGGSQENVGCSTGNCQSAGSNGTPKPHGSASQVYNSANAAANAAAGGTTGSGCEGLSCNNNPEKCTSGHCKPNTSTDTTSPDYNTNKCASGQCGPTFDNGNNESPTDYNSPNDIRVMTGTSDSAHNLKDHSSGFDKTTSVYNGAVSDCSKGKCGSGTSNSKPNIYGEDAENSYTGSDTAGKQQSSASHNVGTSSHYQKPATHLETPKLGLGCTSENCHNAPDDSGYKTSPSSYNVPIHGSYDKGEQKPMCDGVKCENQLPKGAYSSTNSNSLPTNTLNQQHSPLNNPSSVNCGGSGCIGLSPSQNTVGPSLTVKPGSIQFGHSPSSAPHLTVTNCNTANCNPHPKIPGVPAGSSVAPGQTSYGKDTDNESSNDKLPVYTGGFGGPAGVLKPQEFDVAAPTRKPSHVHVTSPQNGVPFGSTPTGCNSPSCSAFPSASGPIAQAGTYAHKPGGVTKPSEQPTYTGGFGGPTGMLKPNEFNIHATVTTRPSSADTLSSSYNTLPSNIGLSGCQTRNCDGYSPTGLASSGVTAPSGSHGTTKPIVGISSPSAHLPTYTGGFGVPTGGAFKPNEYHASGPNHPSYTPSGTYNSPSSSKHPGGCTSSTCYSSNLATTAAANAQTESFGVTKPSSGPHQSSVTLPAYTSGYNSPSGASGPINTNGIASVPSYTHTPSASSQGSYSTSCKTGNCGIYPDSGPSASINLQPGSYTIAKPNAAVNPGGSTAPQYTNNFNGPSGLLKPHDNTYVTPSSGSAPSICKTPNCANSASGNGGVLSGANTQFDSYSGTKPNGGNTPSDEKLPAYTGGFGGASGLLKPNEYTVPASSSTPNNYNKHSITAGATKPAECKTGNCNPNAAHVSGPHSHNVELNGVHATATAAAEANAVAYTGGFGGPPGVLKPYDDGKVGAIPNNGGQGHSQIGGGHYSSFDANLHLAHGAIPEGTRGPTATAGKSGTDGHSGGTRVGSSAGATAYTGAAAGASSGVHGQYTHGSHYNQADNHNGGSPCGGGCGGTSGGAYNGGANFDFSGLPKLGYSDGLHGARGTAGAAAKSLAGANSSGLGSSFASSSASAHASAGAYTKGGYGKR